MKAPFTEVMAEVARSRVVGYGLDEKVQMGPVITAQSRARVESLIGKGVTSGIATSTEVSAFAVVYAFLVGGLAFRELTWPIIVRLFVQSASMTGSILFIVAAASGLGYALTIERIPNLMSETMTQFGVQRFHEAV